MNLEEKKYLLDILDCINIIDDFIGEKKYFEIFCANLMMQDAVIRRLEIIGEATNKLLKLNPNIQISSPRNIVGLRNRIVHEYDNISLENVWAIIINHLPTLKIEVFKHLNT